MMKKKMMENESSGDVRAAFKVFDQDGDGWVSTSLLTKMAMMEYSSVIFSFDRAGDD